MTPEERGGTRHGAGKRKSAAFYKLRDLKKEERELTEQLDAEERDSENARLLQAKLNQLHGEITTARREATDFIYDTPEGEVVAPRNKR